MSSSPANPSRPKRRRDELPASSAPSSPVGDLPPSSLPPSSPPQPFSDMDDELVEDEDNPNERALREEREEEDDEEGDVPEGLEGMVMDQLELGSDEGEGDDLRVGGIVACVSPASLRPPSSSQSLWLASVRRRRDHFGGLQLTGRLPSHVLPQRRRRCRGLRRAARQLLGRRPRRRRIRGHDGRSAARRRRGNGRP
jgi:hypothetical protein